MCIWDLISQGSWLSYLTSLFFSVFYKMKIVTCTIKILYFTSQYDLTNYLVSLKYNQGMQDEYLILSFYLLSCRIIIWCSINLQNWPTQFWENIIVNLQIKKWFILTFYFIVVILWLMLHPIVPSLASGSTFILASVFSNVTSLVFDNFFALRHIPYSKHSLAPFLPQNATSHFSKELWLVLMGNGMWKPKYKW